MRFTPLAARCLEQIVAADDVGRMDRLPRLLDRDAAQMDDAVDALDDLLDRGHVGEIGLDEFLVRLRADGRRDVAQAQFAIDALQQFPRGGADTAGSTSQ